MKEKLKKFRELLTEIIASALSFLCLGIIVQLLINDTILGWDPVGNVKNAGSAFIGIISIVLLYILFMRKK
tara:strand:- start:231 stop:443 length:213 start_codon:yes stop_codon:yes gene_type:complete